jgi:hypothetical protein
MLALMESVCVLAAAFGHVAMSNASMHVTAEKISTTLVGFGRGNYGFGKKI